MSVTHFLGGAFFSFGTSIILSNRLRDSLFSSKDTLQVSNTAQEAVTSVMGNLKMVFSKIGSSSLLDLFTGNIWVIFVFSCGIITIITIYILIKIFLVLNLRWRMKSGIELECIFIPSVFCIIGLCASLGGVVIKWLPEGIAAHELVESISRGHFYLRYYGNFFGPCFLWFIYYFVIQKEKRYTKLSLYLTSMLTSISICYFTFSVLVKNTNVFPENTDWFYYFAPFSTSNGSWPSIKQDLSYYFSATVVVLFICAVLYILILKKHFSLALGLISLTLIWQYTFGVLKFDKPYSESYNYYQSADSIYELSLESPELFEDYDKLYYYNEVYGPEYIVQFLIPDKLVITDLDSLEKDDANLILSNERLKGEDFEGIYWYAKLDENEFLYTNSLRTKQILQTEGYTVWEAN